MAKEQQWKVGDYAMSKGMPIRVYSIDGPAVTIELVADYRSGVGITCGGYCSGGGQLGDLKPITDVEILLRCRAYEARRLIEAAKRTISAQEKIFEAQVAGLRAFQDARDTGEAANG